MSSDVISLEAVRFINLVAARRFAGAATPPPPGDVLSSVHGDTPYRRAASLTSALLAPGALAVAAFPTALLAVCRPLGPVGHSLFSPQGAAGGVVRAVSGGRLRGRWCDHLVRRRALSTCA